MTGPLALSWPRRSEGAISSKMGFHRGKSYIPPRSPRPSCLSEDEVIA